MFDIKEYIKDLIESGINKEDAVKKAKIELKNRKEGTSKQIEIENDRSSWVKQVRDYYNR